MFNWKELGFLMILTCNGIIVSSCGTRTFKHHTKVAYNHYRIQNDPDQVKEASATNSKSLLHWINLKNFVRFKLWTRKNPVLAHEIVYKDECTIRSSNFNASRMTKMIIHGFADTATESSITYYLVHLKDAYLELADFNVFVMDYSLFTMPLFYWTALPDVAAQRLAEFLKFLSHKGGLRFDMIHLVGFSWGAHVAGMAGHTLDGAIARITGLDPAGPTFRFVDNKKRLDKSDGEIPILNFNLHFMPTVLLLYRFPSGTRLFFGGHLGLNLPLGHTDMYPNGGQKQTGCPEANLLQYETLECSHGRAVRLFIESVKSPLAFPACQCKNFQDYVTSTCDCGKEKTDYMGEHMLPSARGLRFLITRSTSPFGLGPQVIVETDNVPKKNKSASLFSSDIFLKMKFLGQSRNITIQNPFINTENESSTIQDHCMKFLRESLKAPITISFRVASCTKRLCQHLKRVMMEMNK